MEAKSINIKPLIVIVGPTASGKTGLAIEIAQKFNGEIISADSRAVYKGMDIGAAKPSLEERQGIQHWGLDLVEPGERFTAFDFKQYANQKIENIRSRGKLPILVGGTGLYVDAVIFDYQFDGSTDELLRLKLNEMSLENLYEYCKKNDILLPENSKNKRYVIRAIEQKSITKKRRTKPIDNSIIVGITTSRDVLKQRIAERSEQIFNNNVVNEATHLGSKYGWSSEAMTGNVYPLIKKYNDKEMTLDQIKATSKVLDWQLAKRQLTWLRRNPFIQWGDREEVRQRLFTALANE